jgi:hypothetical protein
MSNQDRIKRPNGAEWDTVKFACPNCDSTSFEFHMIDDEQHFIMRCVEPVGEVWICGWQSERYTHLPSDVEAPEWPFEPVVDDTQTFEVLVPIDDDGKIIAEVDDFRGKDCDVVLPEVANSLGDITEER